MMSGYLEGDQVVAVKEINHLMTGKTVPRGSPGAVIEGGVGTHALVEFTVKGVLEGDRKVVIEVDDADIART